MSRTSPRRAIGMLRAACSIISSDNTEVAPGVRIWPTTIALTRTFGANSRARTRVIWLSPAFAAEYPTMPWTTCTPAPDEMFTTTPVPAVSTIRGTAKRVSRNGLVRLNRTTFSKARSLVSSAGFGNEPPALLTRMSSRPNRSRVAATRCSSWLVSVTSQATARPARPRSATLAAVSSMSAWVAPRPRHRRRPRRVRARCPRRCPGRRR